MGFNTSVLILNDGLDNIKNDKLFGEKIYNAVHELLNEKNISITSNNFVRAATVIETHHANTTSLIAIGGNYATELLTIYGSNHHSQEFQVELLNQLAIRLGYQIVKKN